MKKFMVVCFITVLGFFITSTLMAADEDEIEANVNSVVEAINDGKAPTDYKAEDFDPYVYIMDEDGVLLVHPSLQGQSIATEQFKPIYEAILQSTPKGVWVDYEWDGGTKEAYVRTTQDGLIVGSGN